MDSYKEAIAHWDISCFVDCPYCGQFIDLMDEKSSGLDFEQRPWPGMNPRQVDLEIEIRCENCEKEFIVNEIEY